MTHELWNQTIVNIVPCSSLRCIVMHVLVGRHNSDAACVMMDDAMFAYSIPAPLCARLLNKHRRRPRELCTIMHT